LGIGGMIAEVEVDLEVKIFIYKKLIGQVCGGFMNDPDIVTKTETLYVLNKNLFSFIH
jgi:hypothetical protein